jgi:hypothetical protein
MRLLSPSSEPASIYLPNWERITDPIRTRVEQFYITSGFGLFRRTSPEAFICSKQLLLRTKAFAYMDVGEGREQGAEALTARRASRLNASRFAEIL